jgi:hypothetical protein
MEKGKLMNEAEGPALGMESEEDVYMKDRRTSTRRLKTLYARTPEVMRPRSQALMKNELKG